MTYSATYEAGDTSKATIDILVAVLSEFFNFATLIALVILVGWVAKKTKGYRI